MKALADRSAGAGAVDGRQRSETIRFIGIVRASM